MTFEIDITHPEEGADLRLSIEAESMDEALKLCAEMEKKMLKKPYFINVWSPHEE